MEEINSASGAAENAGMALGTGEAADSSAVEALRNELAKWQVRVPKLASALRERTSEVEDLKARLADRECQRDGDGAFPGEPGSAGIQARDALIRELEAKVRALTGKHEDLEGQLRARDLEISRLRREAEEWREKWQAVTATLDERADGVEQKARELKRVQRELDDLLSLQESHKSRIKAQDLELTTLRERSRSLESRNQNLFETTELANRQIETLGENLGHLRAELKAARQALAEHQAYSSEKSSFDAALASAREETAAVEARLRDREETHAVLKAEVGRLEACVDSANQATGRFETERRQLSEQQDELKRRNQHLESQLAERSNLVVGLEQEKRAISSRTTSLEDENRRLSEALEKSQKAAAGNADHIAQVDARLERQKQLMENLEAEFAEVQEAYADAVKSHQRVVREKDAELATLRERADEIGVAELRKALADTETRLEEARESATASREALVAETERNRQLADELDSQRAQEEDMRRSLNEKVDRLEQQLDSQTGAAAEAQAAAESAKAALDEAQAHGSRPPEENTQLQAEIIKLENMVRERTEQLNKVRWQQDMLEKQRVGDPSDSRMLMVLNQQLQTTREENGRLRETIRGLEAERQSARETASRRHTAAGDGDRDDLSQIRGVGPKLVEELKKLGITRYDQIATLSEADLDDAEHPLHGMKGRVIKDDWITQAARLSSAFESGG